MNSFEQARKFIAAQDNYRVAKLGAKLDLDQKKRLSALASLPKVAKLGVTAAWRSTSLVRAVHSEQINTRHAHTVRDIADLVVEKAAEGKTDSSDNSGVLVCPFKLKNLVDSAPEGVTCESLPVLVTGPAIGRIACDCGSGISINALSDPEQLGDLTTDCQAAP